MTEGVKFALLLKDYMSDGLGKIGKVGRKAFFGIDSEVEDLNRSLKKTQKETKGLNSVMGGFGGAAMKVGGLLAGVFAVGEVINFGKGVVETTAKFEKFEAVLTNTFGSAERAKGAMDMIQDFASKTPFSVDQLTGGFVKLANQGFAPTEEEMRKLGDLAASTGKDFEQLAEAVLDAQTGEMERLKEFGIKGSQNRDGTVSFRFKGETTTIQNTEEAIRKYLLALGDAEGVSGSMDAISKTLGGQLSNLGDNFMGLQKVIGDQSGGLFTFAIEGLNKLIDGATYFVSFIGQNKDSLGRMFDPLKKAFQPILSAFDTIIDRMNITSDAGSILEGVFNSIATVIEWIAPFTRTLAEVLGFVYTKIYDVAEAMYKWYKRTEWVQNGVKMLYVVFKNTFIEIAEQAKQVLGGIADVITGIFDWDGDKIKNGLGGIWDGVVTTPEERLETVKRILEDYNNPMGMVDLFGSKHDFNSIFKDKYNLDFLKKPPLGIDPDKPADLNNKLNSSVAGSVSGSGGSGRPLTIHIGKLFEDQIINVSGDLKDNYNQIREAVNRALVDSIRDFELSYE
jgi:hypothetical protein